MADRADQPDALADELHASTVALTVELAPALQRLRRTGDAPALAAVPVAAVFSQEPGQPPRHRAGQPSPEVVALAQSAAGEARERLGYGADEQNPGLVALALGAFYAAEGRRSGALGLGEVAARGAPQAVALDPETAKRDPVLPSGARWLRVWTALQPDGDVCVELRFPLG